MLVGGTGLGIAIVSPGSEQTEFLDGAVGRLR
jgi:hypothetical protein